MTSLVSASRDRGELAGGRDLTNFGGKSPEKPHEPSVSCNFSYYAPLTLLTTVRERELTSTFQYHTVFYCTVRQKLQDLDYVAFVFTDYSHVEVSHRH